jgi:hypothetical protein
MTQPTLFLKNQHEPAYPESPGFQATDTSRDAAASVNADELRARVLEALRVNGPMTPDETATYLGVDRLSIRPRFTELSPLHLGRIMDTGERRPNLSNRPAIVWALAPRDKT